MNEQDIQNLWDRFVEVWTVDRVKDMTLEEYIQVGNKNSFTYWLEHVTKPIADIRGGDASKFGIFHRRDQQNKENGRGRIYDNEYCWFEKFGTTKEQAFQTIKTNILNIIKAVKNNNLDEVENIQISDMFKWKIAFLYQERDKLQIVPIFSKSMLDFLTKDKKLNYVETYQHLLKNKGDQSIISYGNQLVSEYIEGNPKQNFLTPAEADEILSLKYPDSYISRQKMTVVTNSLGREIGLVLTGSKASFFIEVDPDSNNFFNFTFSKKKDGTEGKYLENDTRHSSLNSLSEHLRLGSRIFRIEIETANDLEKFCDWYESDVSQIAIVNNLNEDKKMENIINYQALNRILFGAAGTGKTFNTINHTLSIIENKSLEKLDKENRDELKIRFDKYKKEGKVKFVTFHQSFSYEDFVEGIRAETDDQKKLSYNVKAGVFKEICDLAKSDQLTSLLGTEFGRGYIFKSISPDMLIIQKPNGNLIHLALDLAFLLFDSVVQKKITIEDINQKRVLDKLEDNPLLEPYIINGYCAVWANLIQMMVTASELENSQKTPYVLIIDEINRGNISRIFGELITLIEESKRTGAEEELSVTLPYSKQEFSVPSNLYIIGTMNSSDRSLTGLDIALRRRFTFIEMPPRPDLLKDKNGQPIQINAVNQEGENMSINISELLTVINQRIEILLDRDHCIGHANFMSLNSQSTVGELAQIFKQKIIPQLQEYFFDDWSKINMVLNGNGMLKATSLERSKIFPNVNTEDMGFFEDQNIWKLAETEFKKIETFIKIIKHV